jgi:hypothetical protein
MTPRSDDAIEHVRLFVELFAEQNPGVDHVRGTSMGDDLTLSDLRFMLAELHKLRARVIDPDSTYLVTVKLPKNPAHNPRAKQTGQCPFSDECTDVTGEHHSFLTNAEGVAQLRENGPYLTRAELLRRTPSMVEDLILRFLR